MKKSTTHLLIKSFVLFIFWLIFSPLFHVFSIKWKMPRLGYRIVLTFIAPFTLLVLFLGLFSAGYYYNYYLGRGTRTEIETKTGMEFPKFRTLEKRDFIYGSRFTGDFTMEYKAKMDTVKIQDFYNQIELQLGKQRKKYDKDSVINWSIIEDGNCHFMQPWSESQETLDLKVDKKNSIMTIKYGSL
jgi:hypothetical protein